MSSLIFSEKIKEYFEVLSAVVAISALRVNHLDTATPLILLKDPLTLHEGVPVILILKPWGNPCRL